jgi:hypothetical protein
MNIAEKIQSYYSSDDFKDNYTSCLFENFHNDRDIIEQRIWDLFVISNYETEKYLTNYFSINKMDAIKIFDFISENFNSFLGDMVNNYVGCCSLGSISFGEQYEQLDGLRNHKTGKNYTVKYLKHIFNKAGYYVRNNSAYYDLSSNGLQVNLLGSIELLNGFLLTINN